MELKYFLGVHTDTDTHTPIAVQCFYERKRTNAQQEETKFNIPLKNCSMNFMESYRSIHTSSLTHEHTIEHYQFQSESEREGGTSVCKESPNLFSFTCSREKKENFPMLLYVSACVIIISISKMSMEFIRIHLDKHTRRRATHTPSTTVYKIASTIVV